ncbi:MAG: hypothetical protein O7A08_03155 [SAR324 cluster bacterium]|nr:hypothetical protein [SAR324 cluster bacterium]MCZ6629242.1 hypothetical protein [SAR324 cluster bacterium]MCZ6645879.1 hypothetical protein [SAR324 cluster bacterium]
MSLAARYLEANGIPTVLLCSARDITASAFPPRALFVNYPLGNTAGKPFDVENQREILMAALRLLADAREPGRIVDTPHRWSDDESWMERVYDENH